MGCKNNSNAKPSIELYLPETYYPPYFYLYEHIPICISTGPDHNAGRLPVG
jgi:hypothetical protein